MDEIVQCNLIYKVGTLMIKGEKEMLFITVRNDITSCHGVNCV
jgi:hypothetical protein